MFKSKKQVLRNTYHVVNVLPIVQGNQLKGCKHRPQQIVKTSETVIWIVTNMGQTSISCRTWSKIKTESYYFNIFIQLLKDRSGFLLYFNSEQKLGMPVVKGGKNLPPWLEQGCLICQILGCQWPPALPVPTSLYIKQELEGIRYCMKERTELTHFYKMGPQRKNMFLCNCKLRVIHTYYVVSKSYILAWGPPAIQPLH